MHDAESAFGREECWTGRVTLGELTLGGETMSGNQSEGAAWVRGHLEAINNASD